MTDLTDFGQYLRDARQKKGLSLRAVEASTEISNAYLSQLEQGKIKQPSPVVLYKLSEIYEIPYTEVMRLIGYPVPHEADESATGFAARLGPISEEEGEELIDYLDFIRSRRKGDDT